jgi:hypothetical protein
VKKNVAAIACVLAVGSLACDERLPLEPVTDPDVLVLTQSAGLEWFPEALFRGAVIVDGAGCMRLGFTPPDNATVVWPAGSSLWTRGDDLVVRNGEGREVLTVGEAAQFGGGYLAAIDEVSDLDSAQRDAVRDRCPGPYWLVSPGTIRRGPR